MTNALHVAHRYAIKFLCSLDFEIDYLTRPKKSSWATTSIECNEQILKKSCDGFVQKNVFAKTFHLTWLLDIQSYL